MKICSHIQRFLTVVVTTAAIIFSPALYAKAKKQMFIIELKYRTADQMVQAISPILPEDTTLKSFENKILLNTTKETYNAIKSIIETLDVKLTQLRITFYHGNSAPSNFAGIDDEENVDFDTSSMNTDTRFIRSTSRESSRKTDTLLIQSGEVGYIQTAVTLPLLNSQYAYQDRSQASATLGQSNTTIKDSQEVTLPTSLGTRIILPTPEQDEEEVNQDEEDAEQNLRNRTLLSIENPTTTNLPINLPVTPNATLNLKNSNELTEGESQAQRNFNANRQASDQLYEYHRLNNGLFLRPVYMQQSDEVLLEILSMKSTLEQPNQLNQKAYSQFEIQTKLMLPLKQWVYMGGNRLDKIESHGYHYRSATQDKNNQHLWIYIEKSR